MKISEKIAQFNEKMSRKVEDLTLAYSNPNLAHCQRCRVKFSKSKLKSKQVDNRTLLLCPGCYSRRKK